MIESTGTPVGSSAPPESRPPVAEIPFPIRLNPHAAAAGRHHLQWMTAMGLVSAADERARLERWELGTVVAYLFPDAEPEALNLLTDWNGYWAIYDDQFETAAGPQPAMVAAIVDMTLAVLYARPGENPFPSAPFCNALSDMIGRIADTAVTTAWLEHLRRTVHGMLAGFLQQVLDHAQGVVLDHDALILRRRADIAMQHDYDLIAVSRGWAPPESVLTTDTFTRLHNALHDAMTMLNDAYSAYRDRPIFARNYNTVLQLERSGMSARQARAETGRRVQQCVGDYLDTKRSVPELLDLLGLDTRTRAGVLQYLTDVETLFAGADLIQRLSDRYSPEARYSDAAPTHVADWEFARHARLLRR
ncbi:hypothetical protein ACIBCN_35120 [Nocardia sp. NPDC051052]|uniref:terpene synthase family protein n=1 Tax=Nocardia sp. NPDC051052 TaxID=3364322 RepID=UPI00379A808B